MLILKIFCALAGICALATAAVFIAVCVCARMPRGRAQADCLIALGARVRPDGSLSQTLENRCRAAFDAWKNGCAQSVIVCGGRGRDEPCAEAQAMATYLVRAGMPEERVFQDAASCNTVENLKHAGEIMRRQGFRTAALVTSDYHVTRALWIARDMGMRMQAVPAASPWRRYFRLKVRVRETASWILYFAHRINKKGQNRAILI